MKIHLKILPDEYEFTLDESIQTDIRTIRVAIPDNIVEDSGGRRFIGQSKKYIVGILVGEDVEPDDFTILDEDNLKIA